MAIEVRLAAPDDFEPWFALFDEVAAEGRWIGAEAPVRRSWAEPMFRKRIDDEAAAMFLAEVDGLLVGNLHVEDTLGVVELWDLVVMGLALRGVLRDHLA